MYPSLPWISLVIALLAAALWRRAGIDRARVRATWIFLVLWLLAFVAAAVAHFLKQDTRVFDEVARAFIESAILDLGTILVFDFALSKMRLPRLATEVALVAGFIAIIFRLLTRMGSDITGLIATSAVATAVVGFALQDMLGNVVGGAVLELEGGIKVGEWIKAGEAYGCVKQVRLRHTELLTADGETVFIPNSVLTRNSVTKMKKLRRHFVPFLAPYSHMPQEVQRAIEIALTDSPLFGVSMDPRPKCIIQDFASLYVKYSAVVWLTEPGQESTAISGVLQRIYYALSRTGIPVSEIPQILEFHKPRKEDSHARALAVLRDTLIFRLLADEDLEHLASRMKRLSYAPGEYLIRQGEQGDSMFFITGGDCSILLSTPGRPPEQVAVLHGGDFLGEACLLTGEPRTASAVANSAITCYVLDKRGLQDLMDRRPEIAEDMAVIITHRSVELMATRERLDLETARLREAESQTQLLTRIRRFFGIDQNS